MKKNIIIILIIIFLILSVAWYLKLKRANHALQQPVDFGYSYQEGERERGETTTTTSVQMKSAGRDEISNLNLQKIILSSDVYENQYALVRDYQKEEGREYVSLDIITDVGIIGPPENREVRIINQSNKLRNYYISNNTIFVDNPTRDTNNPLLKSLFLDSRNTTSSYVLVTTNEKGELIKVAVPAAG